MAKVIFYEKPGCGGNARQKALLIASGHEIEARNLLTEPWTPDALRSFFRDRPVAEWFNAASPRVKSGEIKPTELTPEAALALMVADPVLIRRPLMIATDRREAGFDEETVHAWIGLARSRVPVTDTCLKEQAPSPGSDGHRQ